MTAAPTHRSAPVPPSPRWLRIGSVTVATALQLVALVPYTVASGLMAPLWAIVGFYLLWVASAAALVVVARRWPLAAPLIPIVNLALLWGGMTLGEQLLGWTA